MLGWIDPRKLAKFASAFCSWYSNRCTESKVADLAATYPRSAFPPTNIMIIEYRQDFLRERLLLFYHLHQLDRVEGADFIARLISNATSFKGKERRAEFIRTVQYCMDNYFDIHRLWEDTMPKYKTRDTSRWSFAAVRLTAEQRNQFTDWAEQEDIDMEDLMMVAILEGYKLSLSHDSENDTWIASLTGGPMHKINPNTTMSGRHGTMSDAVLLVLFKHAIICEQGMWELQAAGEEWG